MNADRTVTAYLKAGQGRNTVTRALTQYDYGQILEFDGVTLPQSYEVVFSNDEHGGTGKSQIGSASGVTIPDEFLTTGKPVFAWLFLHETENDGETVFKIKIPVNKRSLDLEEEPTPVQQSAITQAIAALNQAVIDTEENVLHYPMIQNGYWYVWDAETSQYVNTNVRAQGTTVTVNNDGIMVFS